MMMMALADKVDTSSGRDLAGSRGTSSRKTGDRYSQLVVHNSSPNSGVGS